MNKLRIKDYIKEHKEELIEYIDQLSMNLEEEKTKQKWYEGQFRLYQQKRFGTSNEKINPSQQSVDLFNEAEKEADLNSIEQKDIKLDEFESETSTQEEEPIVIIEPVYLIF